MATTQTALNAPVKPLDPALKADRDAILHKVFGGPRSARKWLMNNLEDLIPDSVCSIRRAGLYRDMLDPVNGCVVYEDHEPGAAVAVKADIHDHVNALAELARLIDQGKLHVGLNAIDLQDAGCWDAAIISAFREVLVHGEVIYG
jgi:hypothetical protein